MANTRWWFKRPKRGYSAVAGIIDMYGGLRFVITDEWRIHAFHVREDEKAFVVPDFYVKEPVPWDHIPTLIRHVERYIQWWINTRNDPDDVNDYRVVAYLRRIALGRQPAALHIPPEMVG